MRRSRDTMLGPLFCVLACGGEVTEGVGSGTVSGTDSSTSDASPTMSGTSTTAGMSGSAGTTETSTSASDGMQGESTDDTTSDGSTDEEGGSTGASMGDGSTSAGDDACGAQPADGPCTTCLKQSCCDDYAACMADMACACWDACLKGGGTIQDCWQQCGAVSQPLQSALGACFEGVCSNACS